MKVTGANGSRTWQVKDKDVTGLMDVLAWRDSLGGGSSSLHPTMLNTPTCASELAATWPMSSSTRRKAAAGHDVSVAKDCLKGGTQTLCMKGATQGRERKNRTSSSCRSQPRARPQRSF